jgi:7-cyano-7-deazaguanine synthase
LNYKPAGRSHAHRSRSFAITPIPGRVAVLASGGLDSSVLLAELADRARRVFPIYVRAGLRWEDEEVRVLRRFIRALRRKTIAPLAVLRLPMDDVTSRHWSVTGRGIPGYRAATASNYIVGRNLSLLAKAAIFCAHNRVGTLAMAPLESNPFPDAQPKFFRALELAVKIGMGLALKIVTPYAGMTKADVIAQGRDLPLALTVSCIRPRGVNHCGSCTKCAERAEGFKMARVPDPTIYMRGARC